MQVLRLTVLAKPVFCTWIIGTSRMQSAKFGSFVDVVGLMACSCCLILNVCNGKLFFLE